MANQEKHTDWFISIEGPRGTGKTTLINSALILRGFESNRTLKQQLSTTGAGETAKRMRKEWQSLHTVIGGAIGFENPEFAEALAWSKYHHMLNHISQRHEEMFMILAEDKVLLRDRYIDTTVVYDAIDIVLSHPGKYATKESRMELLHSMWTMALSVCELPQKTIYLTTTDPDIMLQRGHSFKGASPTEGYELDDLQRVTQRMASEMYQLSFEVRSQLMPSFGVLEICVDGRTPEEVWQIAEAYIISKKERV